MLRTILLWRPLRVIDSSVGAAFTVIGAILLVWVSAVVLRVSPYPSVTNAVAQSRVITAIDTVVPDLARSAMAQARQVVNGGQFPNVFSALGPEPFFDSSAPDESVVRTAAIEEASQSVARVTGIAQSCRKGVEGSGFVIADGLVMTNAHVVAGVSAPRVLVTGDRRIEHVGEVVYFDREKDIAIISVPRLAAAPLELGDGRRGQDAVVAGFPENGPFSLVAARVKGEITAIGWDIYGKERVRREVFAIAAQVRPGNSGGPLFSIDGNVIGMVFARSTTDDGTGYALIYDELRSAIEALGKARAKVSTGGCT
jgi:S1-C subfamily serine protease